MIIRQLPPKRLVQVLDVPLLRRRQIPAHPLAPSASVPRSQGLTWPRLTTAPSRHTSNANCPIKAYPDQCFPPTCVSLPKPRHPCLALHLNCRESPILSNQLHAVTALAVGRQAGRQAHAQAPHNAVHALGFVEALFDGVDVFRRHAPLRKIDVALVFVHTQHQRHLLPPHVDLRPQRKGGASCRVSMQCLNAADKTRRHRPDGLSAAKRRTGTKEGKRGAAGAGAGAAKPSAHIRPTLARAGHLVFCCPRTPVSLHRCLRLIMPTLLS